MAVQGVNQNTSFGERTSQGKSQQAAGGFGEIMELIQNRKSEILEKVKKGETEPVIQIGAQAYTEKQWEKMLESLDDTEKDIKDMIQEAIEMYKKKREQEDKQQA
ncbi:MAG: hypothetical protein NC429_13375 [Lachnospiraceae bacterium]|nr:hypothetical protein [Lachnospiraceae bacterium]